MKNFVLVLVLVTAFAANAQKPVLNHVAHYVTNLSKSASFYKNLIGLDTLPEPFRDGKHAWFSVGPKSHLHLIEGLASALNHPKNHHLCFSVPSVDAFVTRLTKAGVPFEDLAGKPQAVTTRVDGVKQVYFKDPDGYWIDINDAKQ